MNDKMISISELLDLYYANKVSKGTLMRSVENIYGENQEYILLYCDVDFCAFLKEEQLNDLKLDPNSDEKSLIKIEQKNIFRKKTDKIELVTKILLSKTRKPKIDTQIYDFSGKKTKTFWFSQIKNFEKYLIESTEIEIRQIDGLLLDLKENPNQVLITKDKPKLLKRFIYLEMD